MTEVAHDTTTGVADEHEALTLNEMVTDLDQAIALLDSALRQLDQRDAKIANMGRQIDDLTVAIRKRNDTISQIRSHGAHDDSCPTPGKIRYTSASCAQEALSSCWAKMRGGKIPTRYYHCRCGMWHLTSRPQRAGE